MKRKSYYGVIGNGETCAFISPTGSIEWLCLPRFDSHIIYAKALDPRNGESFDIVVFEKDQELLKYGSSQSYVKNTNILKTRIKYKHIILEIRDFMPMEKTEPRRYIIRIINIKNTSKKRRDIILKVQSGIGKLPYKKYRDLREGDMICEKKDVSLGVSFKGKDLTKGGTLRINPNESKECAILLVYGNSKEKVERRLKIEIDPNHELEKCKKFWRNWIDKGKKITFKNKIYENVYLRSLLLLKLMIYQKTGAIVAAPTTSFPAVPGYIENWDYRFTWIRDSYFICRALLLTGHPEETKRILSFFYKIQQKNGHWKSPFYTIDGNPSGEEIIIKEMQGPNKEEMIRVGNAAKDQLQLDSEGSILHATYIYYAFTKDYFFLNRYWKNVLNAANWICKNYNKEENGIWEFREKKAHWTYGKVICYVGIESAIKISQILYKKVPSQWKKTAQKLKKELLRKAWSNQRQAFLQTYDDDAPIDISVLALVDYGLISPKNIKIKKTIKLVEDKLYVNGGILRYEEAVLPFYLPTLWLAGYYIKAGDTRKARFYIKNCINSLTDLYLCAEHFDPKAKKQYGNFPQTFCASSFIEQLVNLKQSKETRSGLRKILEYNIGPLLRFIDKIKR